jgi:hypothetical protein
MEDTFQTLQYTKHQKVKFAAFRLRGLVCGLPIKRTCSRLVAVDTDRLGNIPARIDLGILCGDVQGRIYPTVGGGKKEDKFQAFDNTT